MECIYFGCCKPPPTYGQKRMAIYYYDNLYSVIKMNGNSQIHDVGNKLIHDQKYGNVCFSRHISFHPHMKTKQFIPKL